MTPHINSKYASCTIIIATVPSTTDNDFIKYVTGSDQQNNIFKNYYFFDKKLRVFFQRKLQQSLHFFSQCLQINTNKMRAPLFHCTQSSFDWEA